MKVDIYCNDYFMRYGKAQMTKDDITNMRSGYITGIINDNDTFILRGEPTWHYDFDHLLSSFTNKNYILTTHGNNVDAIINYSGTIPYVSFQWDGIMNDSIKGYNSYTKEIFRALSFLAGKSTITRIGYTISPYNVKWINADMAILRNMLSIYPNMKQPYIMLYQQGTYYSQSDFTWTNITKENIVNMNKLGILTEKNMSYLLAWLNHTDFQCTSPQEEIVVMNDATVRICQSYQFNNILGDLNKNNLADIISSSSEVRCSMANCEYKAQCWCAFHYKDNIDAGNS